jgi:hypothetical protein
MVGYALTSTPDNIVEFESKLRKLEADLALTRCDLARAQRNRDHWKHKAASLAERNGELERNFRVYAPAVAAILALVNSGASVEIERALQAVQAWQMRNR